MMAISVATEEIVGEDEVDAVEGAMIAWIAMIMGAEADQEVGSVVVADSEELEVAIEILVAMTIEAAEEEGVVVALKRNMTVI
jgi:hypothetical protein